MRDYNIKICICQVIKVQNMDTGQKYHCENCADITSQFLCTYYDEEYVGHEKVMSVLETGIFHVAWL